MSKTKGSTTQIKRKSSTENKNIGFRKQRRTSPAPQLFAPNCISEDRHSNQLKYGVLHEDMIDED